MNQTYYTHTDPNNPDKTPEDGADWQILKEHLENTANLAKSRKILISMD